MIEKILKGLYDDNSNIDNLHYDISLEEFGKIVSMAQDEGSIKGRKYFGLMTQYMKFI